jgi:hypothetical protein
MDLATLLRREVQAREATLLVLDGISAVVAKAGAGFEMKRFTHELQTPEIISRNQEGQSTAYPTSLIRAPCCLTLRIIDCGYLR